MPAAKSAQTWLDFQHPDYTANAPRWTLARDFYTGDVLDPAKVSSYLIQKAVGETPEAFQERCRLADYTPHYPTAVDTLAGMLFANEDDANRAWGTEEHPGLGDEDDPATVAGQLTLDADGRGTGWKTLWKQLATELVTSQTAWLLVDSVDGRPQVRILPATSVPNWRDDADGLAEALVVERVDQRATLQDDPTSETRWVHYTREGWTRYHKVTGTNGADTVEALESGTYTYEDRGGRPALPLYRVELPLRRPVGWAMAKKAQALFNKESERDHIIRFANFPIWYVDAQGDDDLYKKIITERKKGANAVPGVGHKYDAPGTDSAAIASTVLERKVDEFWVTFFRQYGDAAREKTATEVAQDVASGVGAFLQMLKAAVDDAENGAFWRVEQTQHPTDRATWFVAKVERSATFSPIDIPGAIERLRKWMWGEQGAIPVGRKAQIAAAKQAALYQGLAVDDADLEAAVDFQNLKAGLDVLREVGDVGKTARGLLAVRTLAVMGLLDPTAEVEMGDGAKRKLADVIRGEIEAAAADAEERRAQEASFFRRGTLPPAGGDAGEPEPMETAA